MRKIPKEFNKRILLIKIYGWKGIRTINIPSLIRFTNPFKGIEAPNWITLIIRDNPDTPLYSIERATLRKWSNGQYNAHVRRTILIPLRPITVQYIHASITKRPVWDNVAKVWREATTNTPKDGKEE